MPKDCTKKKKKKKRKKKKKKRKLVKTGTNASVNAKSVFFGVDYRDNNDCGFPNNLLRYDNYYNNNLKR